MITSFIVAVKPLVFIGLVSYSLYLWHWPVLVYARYINIVELSLGQKLGLLLTCFALAVFSWHFVEKPFRKKALLKKRSWLFASAFLFTAVIVTAGSLVWYNDGYPQRGGLVVICRYTIHVSTANTGARCFALRAEGMPGRAC